jgi:opacity protein-like surface antigen
MKITRKIAIGLGVLGWVALITPPAAAQEESKNYFRVGPGLNFMEDVDLNEFLLEDVAGASLQLNPGVGIGGAVGRNFTDWFAAEFETGYYINSVDSVDRPHSGDLAIGQAPFMVNVVFQLPTSGRFVPFVGGGGGGAATMLYADDFTLGSTWIDGADSSVNYAYQGFAGIRYKFNERSSIVLSYKYTGIGEQDYKPDEFTNTAGDIRLGDMQMHSILIQYMMRF